MWYKLKNLKVLLSLLLVLTWVGGGAGGYLFYVFKQKEIANKDAEIKTLKDSINQLGELVTVYTVASDVKMGKKIEETDLVPMQIPSSMATNLVQDPKEIIGKYYKVDLKAGTAISKDVVYEEELTDDLRLVDLVLHTIPVGLKVGSYVDVRISLPLGEDFIAIPHKKVYAINGGVIKLAINERDIHAYNSMLIDSLLYPGTQLYAVEYLEGGAQKPADAYYPVSKNVLAIAQKDPNLIDAIKADILQRREALEHGLEAIQTDENQMARERLDIILQRGRERLQESFAEAEREHELQEQKRLEQEQQQAQQQSAQ